MRTIPLHGKLAAGRVAYVDDSVFELVMRYRWWVMEKRTGPRRLHYGPYAYTQVRTEDGRRRTILLHTLITGYAKTDHRDGNGLNCQRDNLRPATDAQNAKNKHPQAGGTSRYKGVSWASRAGKWRAQIVVDGQHRSLGYYADEAEAARVYADAARVAFGDFARRLPGS